MLKITEEVKENINKYGIGQEEIMQIENYTEYEKVCKEFGFKAHYESFVYAKHGILL